MLSRHLQQNKYYQRAFYLSLKNLHMQTHRLLFRSFAFNSTCVCCTCIYPSAKLAYFNWSKTCSQKITTYSAKAGRDNSKAVCPNTLFCLGNTAHHHPTNLSIQKAAILYLLCPDSSIQPAWSCTEKGKLWCIYLWRKAVDGNAHTGGPSKLSYILIVRTREKSKVLRVFCQYRAQTVAPGSAEAPSSCQCLSCTAGTLRCPSGSAAWAGPKTQLQRFWCYSNVESSGGKKK